MTTLRRAGENDLFIEAGPSPWTLGREINTDSQMEETHVEPSSCRGSRRRTGSTSSSHIKVILPDTSGRSREAAEGRRDASECPFSFSVCLQPPHLPAVTAGSCRFPPPPPHRRDVGHGWSPPLWISAPPLSRHIWDRRHGNMTGVVRADAYGPEVDQLKQL